MTTTTVFRKRVGRVTAGMVGLMVGIGMYFAGMIEPEWGPIALASGWLAMLPAYGLGRLLGRFLPERDIEATGLWFPMAAITALLPLTLHGIVAASSGADLDGFGTWMLVSGAVVGHVHLALMGMAAFFLYKLRKAPHRLSKHSGWLIYGLCVSVSMIPGAVLLFLPPILTAATGLAFVPWMFYLARRTFLRERAELIEASVVHPRVSISPERISRRWGDGHTEVLDLGAPFRVVLDREPSDGGTCGVHVRLFAARGPRTSVALTLELPREPWMDALSAKREDFTRVRGDAASALWDSIWAHAELHGMEDPSRIPPSLSPVATDHRPVPARSEAPVLVIA